MYVSLYRKYRPQKFSEMIGQSAAVGVLCHSLAEGRFGHAYLFSGPRGSGKTSAARLVAKSLNCLSPSHGVEPCNECENCKAITIGDHLDVIEIDGASNRGIDEIRDLKTHVNLKPLSSKYKVYIIDEVHMLTEMAFNALLKTLEEPPENVVFLLATTEPHKVPVTIRSRCQHIPFHRISIDAMVERILYVCDREGVKADKETAWEIARQSDGALRDALSLTEQCIVLGMGTLSLESIKELTGGSNRTELEKWVVSLRTAPSDSAKILHAMLSRGISAERFTESIFTLFRDLWMYSLWGETVASALEISDLESRFLASECKFWDSEKLRRACLFCSKIMPRTRYGMRLEVFSGLILLELITILEGKAKTESVPLSEGSATRRAAEANRHPTPPVPNLTPAPPRPQPHTVQEQHKEAVLSPLHVTQPLFTASLADHIKPVTVDTDRLCTELGDNRFSKLLSHMGNRAILMGAALLHCNITFDMGGWGYEKTDPSLALNYLNNTQNKMLLRDILYKTFDIGAPAKEEEDAAREAKPSEANSKADTSASITGAGSDMSRIIKLLGAEVLYVKGSEEESEDE